MRILAIDPGKSGGYAISYSEREVRAYPMPETEGDILDLFRCEAAEAGGPENVVAVVEDLPLFTGAEIPGARMAVLHRNFGFLLGALGMAGIRRELVKPQAWQTGLGLGNSRTLPGTRSQRKTAWKNKLKARAQELYPNLKVTLATADALLILEWKLNSTNTRKPAA